MNGYSTNGNHATGNNIKPHLFTVDSPNVKYTDDHIQSKYVYNTTSVTKSADGYVASPKETTYEFKVDRKVGKVGLMMVGWGGNNGSTVTAGIIANRRGLSFATKEGTRASNYYGSLVMGSTMKLGSDAKTGEEVNIPFPQRPTYGPSQRSCHRWMGYQRHEHGRCNGQSTSFGTNFEAAGTQGDGCHEASS